MYKFRILEYLYEYAGRFPPTLYKIKYDILGEVRSFGWPHDSFMHDFYELLTDGQILWDETGTGVLLNALAFV